MEGRLTLAEFLAYVRRRLLAFRLDGTSGLAAYLRVDPDLCGGEPAQSPARANRQVWGRGQRSPPRATTVPPRKGWPPKRPLPWDAAGLGLCRLKEG